jgi:hypothetical protein
MHRYRYYLFVLFVLLIQNSCDRDDDQDIDKTVVINEFMVVNFTTVADQDGEYDDWIELYNLTSNEIDLSGYYLTDSKKNLTKWKFPEGTSITGGGYLIVWADDDTTQVGLHTNYKLSSLGERVLLLTPELEFMDKVEYGSQSNELAYARVPNGTGGFVWQSATFNYQND